MADAEADELEREEELDRNEANRLEEREHLGEEISQQVLEDSEMADEIAAQGDDIAHQTAREFEEKAHFEGEEESDPPHDQEGDNK